MLIDNGRINNKSKIIYGPKTKKKTYSVPIEIISNNCGGLIKIKIIGKNPYYKINKELRVNYKLLIKCSWTVWNKLLDKLYYNDNHYYLCYKFCIKTIYNLNNFFFY